uniref:Uncharacterized protein n=1 Tax=viral metagenome TaxID=1070528 RepID=A0A6C0HY99_9ZZZZ
MPIIIIIEKSGTIKELNIKSYNEDELYKKAGFKVTEGFICQTMWKVEVNSLNYNILLYAKSKGRAGQENKYDFPPPVDNALYFGSCILVSINDSNVSQDLTASLWEKIYEKLFGGFEDIGSEDSGESEDTEPDLPRTKSGYVKDDFIVDSDDLSEYSDASESEEEFIEKKKGKNVKKNNKSNDKSSDKSSKKTTVFEAIETNESVNVPTELNCTTELVEEEYL